MEFTREIYWNVGHGFTTLVPMYLLFLVAAAAFVVGFRKRIPIYRLGQPLDRTDQRGERIKDMLKNVLLQTKVSAWKAPAQPIPCFSGAFLRCSLAPA